MQPDGKYSRFLFHLKFSKMDDYVNEHELYEVMRSRNLYQVQFGVRSNYRKVMRNIIKEERQRKYNFDNTRKMFVQKMKERREQVDKLRSRTSEKLKSLSDLSNEGKKQPQRRYVPLQSTVVYTELPPLVPPSRQLASPPPPVRMLSPPPLPPPASDKASLPMTAPSPSMVATFTTDDTAPHQNHTATKNEERNPTKRQMTAKIMVAGKRSPLTITAKTLKGTQKTQEGNDEDSDTIAQMVNDNELVDELRSLNLENDDVNRIADGNNFESNTKLGKGLAHESTVCFGNNVQEQPHTHGPVSKLMSESKAKEWAEKHSVRESQADLTKKHDYQRLLIDRPSKWALNYLRQENDHTQTLDMRYNKWTSNNGFRRKSKALDALSHKLNLHQRISLPALDTTPKPMVTLDPGGTTPDGRLILTKADYDEYLSNYRKARTARLERSKKRYRRLEKRIEKFQIDPQECLRDETCLRASLRTI